MLNSTKYSCIILQDKNTIECLGWIPSQDARGNQKMQERIPKPKKVILVITATGPGRTTESIPKFQTLGKFRIEDGRSPIIEFDVF